MVIHNTCTDWIIFVQKLYHSLLLQGVVVESYWALECFAFNKDTGSADGWLMKDYYDLGTSYVVSAAHPYANRQLVGLVGTEDRTSVSATCSLIFRC